MEQNPYEAPQAAPAARRAGFKLPGELYPGQHFGCLVQLCAWAVQVASIFLPLGTDAKLALGFGSLAVMAVPAIVACAVLYYRWKRGT